MRVVDGDLVTVDVNLQAVSDDVIDDKFIRIDLGVDEDEIALLERPGHGSRLDRQG